MRDWSAGYVADVGYTFGYYPELNPLRVKLAFLNSGLHFPAVGVACELGFGQGLSINLHATASVAQWHGTDFNPAQAAFAMELNNVSKAAARLYDESFKDFANRDDLPEFDYIGMHGIWSWVSDANRAVIVDFIRRKLKVGGVLYISYNTLPGWAAFAPMRHLIAAHAEVMSAKGRGLVTRIDSAIDFADKLLATKPVFSALNPEVTERVKKLKEQNRHYLAHEYFNKDWDPMHIDTMSKWLKPAKLEYACSASYLDHVDAINLTPEQQRLLSEIPDNLLRESVRDFVVNQQFRRDYWVKGARKLNLLEQLEALRSISVILISHRRDIYLKVTGTLGEASMNESIYVPILDLLADHKVRTIESIEVALASKGIKFAQIQEALVLLAGSGHVATAQPEEIINKVKPATDRLNGYLLSYARGSADIAYLVSPVTGGGISVGRFSQLFLNAAIQGKTHPQEWAQAVWQTLSGQGQKIIKAGKTLETPQENLAELTSQAQAFAEKQLPILKALLVVNV